MLTDWNESSLRELHITRAQLDSLDNHLHQLARQDGSRADVQRNLHRQAQMFMQRIAVHAYESGAAPIAIAVVCDETNNTPAVVNDGEFLVHVKVNDLVLVFEYLSARDDAWQIARKVLESTKQLRAVPTFKVICDETNNSEDDIAQNRLNITIEGSEPWIADFSQRLKDQGV